MPEDFALPDPLPDKYPGETNTHYRHRVIPGALERDRIKRDRWKLEKSWKDAALADDPTLGKDDLRAVVDECRDEWHTENPNLSARYEYLTRHIGHIYFPTEEAVHV